MKYGSSLVYFNIAYAIALVCFLLCFYFETKFKFLTNLIIIMSIILLIVNLIYWGSIRKIKKSMSNIEIQKNYLLRFVYCIFTYIIPVYCIIQEPNLVVSHYISEVTFTIVTILAIIGIVIQRWLFFIESQHNASLYKQ